MKPNNPQSDSKNNFDDELSLVDIINFFQESWKVIVGFMVLGIVGAAIYLWVVPRQFEASAQIKMAQIANVNNNSNNNNNINPLGINIEEPQALISRMALPTSYPKETVTLCGLADQKDPEVVLASKVKLSIPKGVGGTVDLRIRDTSKEIAKGCTNAVYQLIKTSQAQLIAPYIDEASKKLASEEERLGRATQVIARADKSGAAVSAAYLATRDEIRYLLDQISNLQTIINGNESRAAHLTAPIYLRDKPVFPQRRNSMAVGLLLGGFLGLVLALGRKWYRSNR
jgi:uncharacterized protein involved in exopolysaccharide biosynthesis